MKLLLYGVKDTITQETGFIFPARNDGDLRRTVKSGIAAKSPIFCDNIQDKQIFCLGEIETSTGVIVGAGSPIFTFTVQEIVDELVMEIKAHNQKMKEAGLESSVVEVPEDGRKEKE